ncbi:MAG: formyltransferase family protein, partial [Pseudomonadota bacterium]|nr:formyltransferase family protein [Pseudomonadota bacterium]
KTLKIQPIPTVLNNDKLIGFIKTLEPNVVVLFKCGLLINEVIFSAGIPVLNCHCAKLPEYGGIGSIRRALKN